MLFHKGKTDSIHISLVDEDTIMVLVFDDRTNQGMVRVESERASLEIRTILEDVRLNEFSDLETATGSKPKAS